jgi:ribonuclease BN (tRNA processing enzyme)
MMGFAREAILRLQFVGSGDAFGSGGRFNTCFRVERPSGDFLIDCGASTLIAFRKLGIDPNTIGTIFISHLHGDHFGGLPFFILDAQFYSRRQAPLTLVGPPTFKARLWDAMEVFFPGSSTAARKFEIEVQEIAPGTTSMVNGIAVSAVEVRHACGAPPLGLRLHCDGRTIAYSGDTEWTESLIDVGCDADLLIVEALSFEKRITQHLDYASFRTNAPRISAKRIVLTHFGPEMLARLGEAEHETAEDGRFIDI